MFAVLSVWPGLAETILGLLSLTVSSSSILLELLVWVKPNWKVSVGCGWGPGVFLFFLRLRTFEVHPIESSKPLGQKALYGDKSRAKMEFC